MSLHSHDSNDLTNYDTHTAMETGRTENNDVHAADVDENAWRGVEETIEDPEERRVLFCALDSFA